MPLIITPSAQITSVWRGKAFWILKLDIAVIALGGLAIPLMTAFVTQYIDVQAMPSHMDVQTSGPDTEAFVHYPGPAQAGFIVSRLAGCLLPPLLIVSTSTINLFYTFPNRSLHPGVSLVNSTVMFFLSLTATILTAHDVAAPPGPSDSPVSSQFGFTTAPGVIAVLCTILLCISFAAYASISAVAWHGLRLYGPTKDYAQSEYASEYNFTFVGSTAGSTKRIKVCQTPTHPTSSPNTSSVFESRITSPVTYDEEVARNSLRPPLPARAATLGKRGDAPRAKMTRSVQRIKSAPLAGPRTPRSPLSPHNSARAHQVKKSLGRSATSTVVDVAARRRQQRGLSIEAEEKAEDLEMESPVEGLIDRSRQSYASSRKRALSLEGKAKRELMRMRVERLDVESAQKYKTKQVGQARAVGVGEVKDVSEGDLS